MPSQSYPDLFNDVFGPVMQPGSSSHTAGPCRLGLLARSALGAAPAQARIVLDPDGSFAGTLGVMSEEEALVAGLLGFGPDDPRLFSAPGLARTAGLRYEVVFEPIDESDHPNTVRFELTGAAGESAVLTGVSTGGGMVETRLLDGFDLRERGDAHVVVATHAPTVGAAAQSSPMPALPSGGVGEETVSSVLTALPGLIRRGRAARANGAVLVFATLSEPVEADERAALARELPGWRVRVLEPVLPVLDRPGRVPPLFATMGEWRAVAGSAGERLSDTVVRYEMGASGWSRGEVLVRMRALATAMRRQTHAVYEEPLVVPESPVRRDWPRAWERHQRSARRVCDDLTARIIQLAYGAGAGIPGVETVPGPMGSGGGYVFAALRAVQERKGLTDDDLLRGLLVAGGVGIIAFSRTEPTGEAIGCTGETGVCGAMAAAGAVEMMGGTGEEVENAASLALQGAIGLPCDPIPGGLGQPCRSRVIAAACMAPVYADLALAGRDAVLPLHEAIDVADAVGRNLPAELLCTSRGGAAAAPAAREMAAAYEEWLKERRASGEPLPPGNLI